MRRDQLNRRCSILLAAVAAASTAYSSHAAITSSGNVSPAPPQTAGADPIIGVNDLGRFTITASSVVLSDQAVIGQQFTGIGFAVVSGFDSATGSGAVWTTNNMVVGSSGTGSLEVLSGAVVTVDVAGNPGSGDLTIGLNPDSVGTVLVSGRGSILRIGDDTNIGHNPGSPSAGTGTLIIENEGFVIATNDAATGADAITIGLHGRIELNNGRLRGEVISNGGTIIGRGRIDNETTISNLIAGRVESGPGDRLVINSGTTGGLGFDNDGQVSIVGGEIEFFEQFVNSNLAAAVTLRDGARIYFPTPAVGFGFDSTGGVLATTAGVNDIYGSVRIQTASSKIVVGGGSTAVFHGPVTNNGGTIEVLPGSTPIFLQGLTGGLGSALSMTLTAPSEPMAAAHVGVVGGAQLDGQLQIKSSAAFAPQVGDQFEILSADSVTGTFDSTTSDQPGIEFQPIYTATKVRVIAANPGDKTWGVDAGGNSSAGGNWLGGVAPNGIDQRAAFTTIITASRTVTVDTSFTAGALYFDDNNSYSIQGPGSIALQTSSGNAHVDVKNLHGATAHAISAPLAIASHTDIDIDPGSSLAIGPLAIAAGQSVTKSGSGSLTISGAQAHAAGASFIAQNGTTRLNSNAGSALTLKISGNGKVTLGADQDLRDLAITTSDPGPQQLDLNTPATPGAFRSLRVHASNLAAAKTSLQALIRSAIINPTDGIHDSGLAAHPSSALGLAQTGSLIFIRPTRIGDLNLDGMVTISDFIDLAAHFNSAGTWQEGDLNYDGQVTISDFIDLASNFNTNYAGEVFPISPDDQQTLASFAAANGVFVPEPAVFALLAAATLLLGRRRR